MFRTLSRGNTFLNIFIEIAIGKWYYTARQSQIISTTWNHWGIVQW